jgi:hypothetical protein
VTRAHASSASSNSSQAGRSSRGAADEAALGVLLALVIRRVRVPGRFPDHLRLEDVVGPCQAVRRRRLAQARVVPLPAQVVQGVALVGEQVPAVKAVVGGQLEALHGLPQRLVGEVGAREDPDGGLAAGDADGHQVGMKFLLARQGP